MTPSVAQLIRILDRIAPPRLAESWDNVGLQIGSRDWPVRKIWTALDPLPDVVEKACENNVDLLITHHPLFFKPIRQIHADTPLGRIIERALSSKTAIFSAHTNLDSAKGGVNDVLARRLGLHNLRTLQRSADADMCKLVVFVPMDHVKAMYDTIRTLGIGRIGNYSCCTFRSEGLGTFLPGGDASPAIGEKGILNEVAEVRLEAAVRAGELEMVLDALKKAHPYETMAYDIYPLSMHDDATGLGRVGKLEPPLTLEAFCNRLKMEFHLPVVKAAGNALMKIDTVAVCSGSGSSLMASAVSSGAQAYVSGDLGYHAARDAQQAGIGLIDIGHFFSEHFIADELATAIHAAADALDYSIVVESVDTEEDPFHYL